MRDSASLTIVRQLMREGAQVIAYDPEAGPNAQLEIPNLNLAPTLADALLGANGAIIMTEWQEFSAFDWAESGAKLMQDLAVADFRNLLNPNKLRHAGFKILNLGRLS